MLLREVTVGRVGVGVAVVGPVITILYYELKWLHFALAELPLPILHPRVSCIIDSYLCVPVCGHGGAVGGGHADRDPVRVERVGVAVLLLLWLHPVVTRRHLRGE